MQEAEADQEPVLPVATGQALAGVMGTTVGLVIGGPKGAVLGAAASPYTQAAIELLRHRVSERRQANAARVVEGAATTMGIPVSEFMSATEDPCKELLVETAVVAAGNTVYEEKLVLLGRLLGQALADRDDATLDSHGVLIAAIADLEPPHVALLGKLSESRMVTPDPKRPSHKRSSQAYSRRELAREFPQYGVGLDALLATLERHGLIARVPVDVDRAIVEHNMRLEEKAARRVPRPHAQPPTLWSRTEFGRTACDVFREAAERADIASAGQPRP